MRTRLIAGSLAPLLLLLGQTARALPGSHAPAISTYDTRASSIVLAYRHGSSDAGPFNTYSYNANFTNTSGKLSAQFGIHYVNFASKENDARAHGVGASGVALFVFPVAGRYDNGVPKAAIAFDVGAVPTVYVSSERNYLTLPLVIGFGVPLSPHRVVTFTPWFELAPSANLDTIFKPADITFGSSVVTPIQNPDGTFSAKLNETEVEAAVKKGVTVDYGFSVPMRAGLEAAIHLGESADFNLYTSIASLRGGFSGASVFSLGAGLVFRWDDMVPAVLPPERRLERESCDAVEARFRSCPNSRQWISPEQRAPQPQTVAPARALPTTPTAATIPASPGASLQAPATTPAKAAKAAATDGLIPAAAPPSQASAPNPAPPTALFPN